MARIRPSRSATNIYELRVRLCEIEPAIWRLIWVPDTLRLSQLHRVIQWSMGWTNSHLHEFRIGDFRYGMVDAADDWGDTDLRDERRFTVGKVLGTTIDQFIYEYDFGDGWTHFVRVQRLVPASELNNWPMCLGGENACPPEDVGGPLGFLEFVRAMRDEQHPEHQQYWIWNGGPYDSTGFDLNAANERLRRLG